MSRRVTIFGSMGYNLGDQAIAMEVSSLLIKNDYIVRIASVNPDLVDGRSIFLFDRSSIDGWIRVINEIKAADMILIGGGTMIQDKLGINLIKGMLPMVLQIAILAKLMRKKVGTIAIGADDLCTNLGRIFAKNFLKLVDTISVRDELAKRNVENILDSASVKVVRDPAFLHEGSVIRKENYAVLSLVHEDLFDDSMIQRSIHIVEEMLKNFESVKLICMDIRPSEEFEIYSAIVKAVNNSRISIEIPNDYISAAQIIRSSKLCICFRLHAIILGFGYTDIVAYSRSAKTRALGEYLGLKILNADDFKSGTTYDPSDHAADFLKLTEIKQMIPIQILSLVKSVP